MEYNFEISIIIFVAYFIVIFFRKKIYRILKASRLNKKIKNYYMFVLRELWFSCKIRINNIKKTFLIPIISVILLNILIYSILKMNNPQFTFYEKLISTFISPVSEELIYRGLLLGFASISLTIYIFAAKKWKYSKSITITSAMLISLFFMYQHPQPNPLPFFSSMLYSFLYLYDDRNLTAPVIAHIINNIIANFLFFIL